MRCVLTRSAAKLRIAGTVLLVILCALSWTAGPAFSQAENAVDDYNLAIGMYKQKRWSYAADSFRKFLQASPRHEKAEFAKLYLGLALVNLEKYAEARDVLAGYLKDHPKAKYRPDATYRVAECSYLLDELKAAESQFQAFLRAYPKHDLVEWALPYLADSQLRLDQPREAAANFARSLELYPEGRLADDSKFGLARAYDSINEPAKALQMYEQLARNREGKRAAQAQFNLAAIHFDADRFSEAADAYLAVEKHFPQNSLVPVAQLNAGYALYQLGKHDDAIVQFEQAGKTPAQAPTAQYWKGVSLKAQRKYEAAVEALATAAEAGGDDFPLADQALYHLADSQLRRGNHAKAKESFLRLVEEYPQSESVDDALHFAAEAAMLAGNLNEAEELLTRFSREHSQSSLRMYHDILAARVLIAKQGEANLQQAIPILQQVLDETSIDQTRMLARFHLARAYEKLDENQRAVEVIQPLLSDLEKSDDVAREEFIDAYMLAGAGLFGQKQYEDAIKPLTRYLELRPNGDQADQALSTRALALAHLKQEDALRRDLKILADRFPDSPRRIKATYNAAEIAYDNEQWDLAADAFVQIVATDSDGSHYASSLAGLAWSQFQAGKYREAAGSFGNVVMKFPDDPILAPEAAYKRAESLQKADLLTEAAAAYQEAFEAFSDKKDGENDAAIDAGRGTGYYAYRAGLQAARVARQLGEVEKADAAYDALLDRFPESDNRDKLLDEWALLNYEAKRFERADEIFRRLVREAPGSDLADDARLNLAESTFISGNVDEAERMFRELAAGKQSDDAVREIAAKHLVSIAVDRRDWKEVASRAEDFVARHAESTYRPEVAFRLAEAKLHNEDLPQAREILTKLKSQSDGPAVRESAWYPRIWILLAEIAFRNKEYDEAVRLVRDLRDEHPQSELLYQADEVLGRTYKNQAKFEDARNAFERVVQSPHGRRTETAAKSQFLIAETYLLEKDYRDAQREYLKVYHLYKFPQWQAPSLFQAAKCDEALEQWESAERSYEELLREFADSEFAAKAKPRLQVVRQKSAS